MLAQYQQLANSGDKMSKNKARKMRKLQREMEKTEKI
jgi:cell fate (sporulation/competence/biofilm development) regulator YlbF (YheA/YmcA/DUF963 family)